jgi:hypothetical protein
MDYSLLLANPDAKKKHCGRELVGCGIRGDITEENDAHFSTEGALTSAALPFVE